MTPARIADGLRSRYPLQAARAKAFRRYLLAMGLADRTGAEDARRATRLTFWTRVCYALEG